MSRRYIIKPKLDPLEKDTARILPSAGTDDEPDTDSYYQDNRTSVFLDVSNEGQCISGYLYDWQFEKIAGKGIADFNLCDEDSHDETSLCDDDWSDSLDDSDGESWEMFFYTAEPIDYDYDCPDFKPPKYQQYIDKSTPRQKEILSWLKSSKYGQELKKGNGFYVIGGSVVKLKNGNRSEIIDWLNREGIRNNCIISKYRVYQAPPRKGARQIITFIESDNNTIEVSATGSLHGEVF